MNARRNECEPSQKRTNTWPELFCAQKIDAESDADVADGQEYCAGGRVRFLFVVGADIGLEGVVVVLQGIVVTDELAIIMKDHLDGRWIVSELVRREVGEFTRRQTEYVVIVLIFLFFRHLTSPLLMISLTPNDRLDQACG